MHHNSRSYVRYVCDLAAIVAIGRSCSCVAVFASVLVRITATLPCGRTGCGYAIGTSSGTENGCKRRAPTWSLSRQKDISGESLQLAAKVLRDKWKARCLDMGILLDVQKNVFSVQEAPGSGS